MKRKINVGFFPYSGGLNPYIDILREDLVNSNLFNVNSFEISIYHALSCGMKYDVVYLNWYENIQGSNIFRTIFSALKRIVILLVLKMHGCKIIIFIHNRLPHNARNVNTIKLYEKIVYSMADKLAVLSSGTKEVVCNLLGAKFFKKISFKFTLVHEPTYIGSYPELKIDFRNRLGIDNDKFVYLFFGSIQPYKNIEMAIDVAKDIISDYAKASFVFYGLCKNDYYLKLKERINGVDRIMIIPEEIKNEELTSLIRCSNVVLMPLNQESSINSGTCFLSLCCNTNVICPEIESLKDFKEKSFYTYTYQNTNDHYTKLLEMSKLAIEEFYNDKDKFKNRINLFEKEIRSEYSREKIYGQLSNLIFEVVGGYEDIN